MIAFTNATTIAIAFKYRLPNQKPALGHLVGFHVAGIFAPVNTNTRVPNPRASS